MGFLNKIFGLESDRMKGLEFVKEFKSSENLIKKLEELKKHAVENIQNDIDRDIYMIQLGDVGERNVEYELKNSFINMQVLHNVTINNNGHKAQFDFILITEKFICVLETKKLNGNIEINNSGDFVRHFTNKKGKIYKVEGMYSPITQNQRHVRILEELMKDLKLNKKIPIYSLVVLANPKTIINFKYAKKEIKDQIIKLDQMTRKINELIERTNKESNICFGKEAIDNISSFIMKNHVEEENGFLIKYQNIIEERKGFNSYDDKKETSYIKKTHVSKQQPTIKKDNQLIKEKLIEYRKKISKRDNIKAYIVYNNKELDELIDVNPSNEVEFLSCPGFGKVKYEKYGADILRIINEK